MNSSLFSTGIFGPRLRTRGVTCGPFWYRAKHSCVNNKAFLQWYLIGKEAKLSHTVDNRASVRLCNTCLAHMGFGGSGLMRHLVALPRTCQPPPPPNTNHRLSHKSRCYVPPPWGNMTLHCQNSLLFEL